MTGHDPDFDLLAAGALLDDLDPGELERFEAHQIGCTHCAGTATDLRATLGDLALAAAPRRPPDSLAAAVLAGIATEPRVAAAAAAIPMTPAGAVATPRPAAVPASTGARSWSDRFAGALGNRTWLAPVAAGLVVLTVATGAWGLSSRAELDRVTAGASDARRVADAEARAIEVAMAPDHATAALQAEPLAPTAHAVVMYRPGHSDAVLVARDLPPTPAGKVYQVWVADGTGVHGLATYHYDGTGTFVAAVGRDLAGSQAVMVTLEPEGGAVGDPGPQVVFGTL